MRKCLEGEIRLKDSKFDMLRVEKILWAIAIAVIACFGLTLSWPLMVASVLCLALVAMVAGIGRFFGKACPITALDGLFAVTLGYFGWRAWQSPVWDLARYDLMLMAGGTIIYLLVRLGRRAEMASATVGVMAATVLANGLVYLTHLAGGEAWIPLDVVSKFAQSSPDFGLFQDYGSLGNAMAVIGMVLCSFAVAARTAGIKLRSAVGVIGAFALILAFMSGSRSAALALVVAAALMVVVLWLRAAALEASARKRVRLIVLAGACCAGTLVAVFALRTFVERDGKVLQTGVTTEQNVRQGYWGMAIDQVAEAPLLGSGARSYSYKSNTYWLGALVSSDASPDYVHNEYLQVLADYGIVGLVLLLGLLGAHWLAALKSLALGSAQSRLSWLRMAGLLGLTLVMVQSFTDFPLRVPFNMVLAAVCLAWCAPPRAKENNRGKGNGEKGQRLKEKGLDDGDPCGESMVKGHWSSGLDDGNKGRGERVKGKGLAVVLIILSAGVAMFTGRELWASAPLLLEKQQRVDFDASSEEHQRLLQAYTLSNQRSPDFRKSQRIGQIYQIAYERGQDPAAFEMAEASYKQSLQHHPYNLVAMLSLANLYRDGQRFAEAETYYARVEPYVAARDWSFKFYSHLAEMKLAQAELAFAEEDYATADTFLTMAAELAMLGRSASLPRLMIERDCFVGRVRIAVKTGDYENADALWLATKTQVKPWILNAKEARVYRQLGDAYFVAATKEWEDRNPALAKLLFNKALAQYQQDKRSRNVDETRQENTDFAERAVKTLKAGGF